MYLWIIIAKSAVKSLLANKMRSVLAMLGIIIGVGAVIAMLAMGAGAQKGMMDRITAMGTNLLVIRPGQSAASGVKSGTQINLTLEDAQALVSDIPHLVQLAPVVSGNAQVKYSRNNARTNITGTSPTYLAIRDFVVEKGRPFSETESDGNARVALLGPVTVTNLFGTEDPLGEQIKINGINFQVVGVLKAKGDQGFYNPDDQILVPYTTAMNQLFGQAFKRTSLREIDIQADSTDNLNLVMASVTEKLRKSHRLQDHEPNDFEIRNQADTLQTMNSFIDGFRFLLASIACISLLVGGIGIMNIMLVTVTERTREIGVRKAIGAKDRDILSQFLVESVIMSGLGGILGAIFGGGLASLIPLVPMDIFQRNTPIVRPEYVILSVTVSAVIGIFFGVYPAWKASQLDPIDALRYE